MILHITNNEIIEVSIGCDNQSQLAKYSFIKSEGQYQLVACLSNQELQQAIAPQRIFNIDYSTDNQNLFIEFANILLERLRSCKNIHVPDIVIFPDDIPEMCIYNFMEIGLTNNVRDVLIIRNSLLCKAPQTHDKDSKLYDALNLRLQNMPVVSNYEIGIEDNENNWHPIVTMRDDIPVEKVINISVINDSQCEINFLAKNPKVSLPPVFLLRAQLALMRPREKVTVLVTFSQSWVGEINILLGEDRQKVKGFPKPIYLPMPCYRI